MVELGVLQGSIRMLNPERCSRSKISQAHEIISFACLIRSCRRHDNFKCIVSPELRKSWQKLFSTPNCESNEIRFSKQYFRSSGEVKSHKSGRLIWILTRISSGSISQTEGGFRWTFNSWYPLHLKRCNQLDTHPSEPAHVNRYKSHNRVNIEDVCVHHNHFWVLCAFWRYLYIQMCTRRCAIVYSWPCFALQGSYYLRLMCCSKQKVLGVIFQPDFPFCVSTAKFSQMFETFCQLLRDVKDGCICSAVSVGRTRWWAVWWLVAEKKTGPQDCCHGCSTERSKIVHLCCAVIFMPRAAWLKHHIRRTMPFEIHTEANSLQNVLMLDNNWT